MVMITNKRWQAGSKAVDYYIKSAMSKDVPPQYGQGLNFNTQETTAFLGRDLGKKVAIEFINDPELFHNIKLKNQPIDNNNNSDEAIIDQLAKFCSNNLNIKSNVGKTIDSKVIPLLIKKMTKDNNNNNNSRDYFLQLAFQRHNESTSS